jgi:hypothetical protein
MSKRRRGRLENTSTKHLKKLAIKNEHFDDGNFKELLESMFFCLLQIIFVPSQNKIFVSTLSINFNETKLN